MADEMHLHCNSCGHDRIVRDREMRSAILLATRGSKRPSLQKDIKCGKCGKVGVLVLFDKDGNKIRAPGDEPIE